MAARGRLGDFAAAEQAFLGIESLSLYLGDADRIASALDALYATVESDQTYKPKKFRDAASAALSAL